MNYKYLYCIILFVCISQAGYSQRLPWRNLLQRQQTQQQIPTIGVDPVRITYGNIRLSDIIESIEYVLLETTDESLIGRIHLFDISDNYIVVYCAQTRQVFLFSITGRFIGRVGRRGAGPGEYASVGSIFIDEKRERVLIVANRQRKILTYNLRGEFVEYILMDGNMTEPTGHYRRFHNDHFFIATDNFNGNVPFIYNIRDINLQLITEDIRTVPFERGPNINVPPGGALPINYLFNNKVHVRSPFLNDTIFSIGSDFLFTPRFVVCAGRRAVSISLLTAAPDRFLRQIHEHVTFNRFFETADKLLISYNFRRSQHFAYFDKNTERLYHFRSERGIPNDFDGGIDFWPRRQDNSVWYAFYYPYYLIENSGGITPTGSTAAVQSFDRLIERLDPDDNPVLMIVRLK